MGEHTNGVTIYPFIFIKYPKEETRQTLINHEKIHIKQQLKWLIIPFFLMYGIEYLIGRIKGMNHDQAYRNISFEKEAYELENKIERSKKWD